MKVQHTFKATANGYELRAQDGSTITISKEHKKFNWLAGQDANRVINVYPNGKMTSSADYKGLYASQGTTKLPKVKLTTEAVAALGLEAINSKGKCCNRFKMCVQAPIFLGSSCAQIKGLPLYFSNTVFICASGNG